MKAALHRLIPPVGTKLDTSPFVALGIEQPLACDVLSAMANTQTGLLWLYFRKQGDFFPPALEMFPLPGLRVVAERFANNAWQRNQVIRLYGQLLARELRALGVAVLEFSPVDGEGRGVFCDDVEANASMTAALWSGLRTDGVAMALDLVADGHDGVDWRQAELSLVSGVPFVVAATPLASGETARILLRDMGYGGVICAKAGDAPESRLRQVLDEGWHVLIVGDGHTAQQAVQLAGMEENVQRDAELRLGKRAEQLKAVPERGGGFAALDRDPEYHGRRHIMARKLGIEDAYTDAGKPARYGSLVRFHYVLYDAKGEEIERSCGDGVRAVLGRGMVIPGLEQALFGRARGERFSVRIPPEEAYGDVDASLRFSYPAKALMVPPGSKIVPGIEVTAVRGPGNAVQARIAALNGDEVLLDGNHPLAGKTLHFEVAIEQII